MGRGLDGFVYVVPVLVWLSVQFSMASGGALTSFRWLWRGGNTSSLSEQSS